MDYPTPKDYNLYSYINESTHKEHSVQHVSTAFSWETKNKYMDEYIEYINSWSWLWTHIPCIRQIYLCNSITFNALHNNSDIDICIITK